jgi:integrase
MVYSFARIGAVLTMNVPDVFTQGRRLWVRLLEKGGKLHEMPCHHSLEEYLITYIERGNLADDPGPLFRSVQRDRSSLSPKRLQHANAYDMVQRRCSQAGVSGRVCCHSFRATGITTYLSNGGTIERAAVMANHTSIRTTQLYDRRDDQITLDEVERIVF